MTSSKVSRNGSPGLLKTSVEQVPTRAALSAARAISRDHRRSQPQGQRRPMG
jgi:hypothetical protein